MLTNIAEEKKEFNPMLDLHEKKEVVGFIRSYGVMPYFGENFGSKELLEITDTLKSKYSFKETVSEESFNCFAKDISLNFGCGPSMTREMIDSIKFFGDALEGAPYGGLIGAIGGSLAAAIYGSPITKIFGYGLLGAITGGVYNGYSEKSLRLNNKFDEAISKCFFGEQTDDSQENVLTSSDAVHKAGEMPDILPEGFEF